MQSDDNIFMKTKDVQASEDIPQEALTGYNRAPGSSQEPKIELLPDEGSEPVLEVTPEDQATSTKVVPGDERITYAKQEVAPETAAEQLAYGKSSGIEVQEALKGQDLNKSISGVSYENPLSAIQMAEIGLANDFLQAKELLEGRFGFKKADYIKDYGIVVQKHNDPENTFRRVQININPNNGKLDFDFASSDELTIDNRSKLFLGSLISSAGGIAGSTIATAASIGPSMAMGAEIGGALGTAIGPLGTVGGAVAGSAIGAAASAIGVGSAGGAAAQLVQDAIFSAKSRKLNVAQEIEDQVEMNALGFGIGTTISLGYKTIRAGAMALGKKIAGLSGEAATAMKHRPLAVKERAGAAPLGGETTKGFQEERAVALGQLRNLEEQQFKYKQEADLKLKDITAEHLRTQAGLEGQLSEIETALLESKYQLKLASEKSSKRLELGRESAKEGKERAQLKLAEASKTKMVPGYIVDETAAQQTGKKIQVKTEEALDTMQKERKELYGFYKNDIIAEDVAMQEAFDATSPSSAIILSPGNAQLAKKELSLYDFARDVGQQKGLTGPMAEAITDANIQSVGAERALYDFAETYLRATPADRIRYQRFETSVNDLAEVIRKDSSATNVLVKSNPREAVKQVIENNLALRTELQRELKGIKQGDKYDKKKASIIKKYESGGGANKVVLALDTQLVEDLSLHLKIPSEEAHVLAKNGTYADLLDFHQVFSDKLRSLTKGATDLNPRQAGLKEIQKSISNTLAVKNPAIKEMNIAYAQTGEAIIAARTAIVDKSLDEVLKRFTNIEGGLELNDIFRNLHSTALKHGYLDSARQLLSIEKDVFAHVSKMKQVQKNIDAANLFINDEYKRRVRLSKQRYEDDMAAAIKQFPVADLTAKKGQAKWNINQLKRKQESIINKTTAENKALEAERDNYIKIRKQNTLMRDAHLETIQGRVQKAEEGILDGDSSSLGKAAAYSKVILKGLYGVQGVLSSPDEKVLLKKMMARAYRNDGIRAILDVPYGGKLEAEHMFYQKEGDRYRSILNSGERPDEVRSVVSKRLGEEKDNYVFNRKQYLDNIKEAKKTLSDGDIISQAEVLRKLNHHLQVSENLAGAEASKLQLQNIKYAAHEVQSALSELGIDINKYNKQVWAKQLLKSSAKREAGIRRLVGAMATLGTQAGAILDNKDYESSATSEAFAVEVLTLADKINQKRMLENKNSRSPQSFKPMVDTDGIMKFLKEEVGGK
jgi:hypothetical protein